jgi:hypothetical protein
LIATRIDSTSTSYIEKQKNNQPKKAKEQTAKELPKFLSRFKNTRIWRISRRNKVWHVPCL